MYVSCSHCLGSSLRRNLYVLCSVILLGELAVHASSLSPLVTPSGQTNDPSSRLDQVRANTSNILSATSILYRTQKDVWEHPSLALALEGGKSELLPSGLRTHDLPR